MLHPPEYWSGTPALVGNAGSVGAAVGRAKAAKAVRINLCTLPRWSRRSRGRIDFLGGPQNEVSQCASVGVTQFC
jgi:hypothetical protein